VGSPAWSPDGARIAFVSEEGHQGKMDLYVMNADGSAPTRLTEAYENVYGPTWSPDGAQIAFGVWSKGTKSDIYIVDADGSNARRLTEHPANDSAPAWSPIPEREAD
jgi:TolB protein